MTRILRPKIAPDRVVTFNINPGTLPQFLETRPEGVPRLKCFEASVTLASPGKPHETAGARLASLILAICLELKIKHTSLRSTTWTLPSGAGDTAYEADWAYYIQSHGTAEERQPPDLAIEVVVSHPELKALRAGALLRIPEIWIFDLPPHRLTFYHLPARGRSKNAYRAQPQSRAFPLLKPADVLARLDDPETDDGAYHENCRAWARNVLVPRARPSDKSS